MPWSLIITVVLQLIDWFVGNSAKNKELKEAFVKYVESRTKAASASVEARVAFEESFGKLKANIPENFKDHREEKAPLWYEIATKEVGVTELPGDEHSARVLEYHQATSLKATDDETPWCAAFVCWCLEQAGIASTRSAAARSFLRWGEPVDKPFVGCIVVLKRGRKSWQGHVGLYANETKDMIYLLGGNQLNKVGINAYHKRDILGFRRPS